MIVYLRNSYIFGSFYRLKIYTLTAALTDVNSHSACVFSLRDASQRWQPTPGSKAAMLVKVNSMSRSQPSPALQQHLQHSAHNKANTFTLHPSSNKAQGGHLSSTQGYKTAPSGKMAADTRQAHHLRKASNGSFCLVTSDSNHPSPLLHR